MGATFWQTHLEKRTGFKRKLPPAMGIDALEPFSFNSRFVAYQAVHLGLAGPPPLSLFLAEVTGRRVKAPRFDGFISSIRWSPKRMLLLVLAKGRLAILDADGHEVAAVTVSTPPEERAIVGWTPTGAHFFVIARTPDAGRTTIAFYSQDGRFVDEAWLDPADVVPYDSDTYASIGRDEYSLDVAPGTQGVGRLLDSWGDAEYDSRTGKLLLSVYRPESERADGGRRRYVPVGVRWVAVSVFDDS